MKPMKNSRGLKPANPLNTSLTDLALGLKIPKNTPDSTMGVSRNDTPSREEYLNDPYLSLILPGTGMIKNRLLVAVPSTGTVRMEWAIARYGQTIPTNWTAVDCVQWMNQVTPFGYNVADARNMVVHIAVQHNYEWVFWIDSDVILPPNTFMLMNDYTRKGDIPVVFGLYCTKSHPSEPLVYRGIGTSYFRDFNLGDTFWVSAIGMGCTLTSVKLLRVMYEDAPYYMAGGEHKIKRVFDTPQVTWLDPDSKHWRNYGGTEDISWCKRVTDGDYMRKAGFTKVGKQKYQFLVRSDIFCGHIDQNGVVFPLSTDW